MEASSKEGALALPSPFSSGTPTQQPAHTARGALSTAPISQPPSEIPPTQRVCKKGVVLLVHHSFHRGADLACSLSSGV